MKRTYDASAWKRAEAYIYDIPKFTKKNTLENTNVIIRQLGNPGMDKKIIHVAGTNGKGSVCNYLSELLKTQGYRVGMFTSPHLISMNERIRISGEKISKEKFLGAYERLREFLDKKKMEDGMIEKKDKLTEESEAADNEGKVSFYHPTFFEFLFLIGMLIFEEEQVDVIILETGLGGRLDATNIVSKPWLTIITEIGLDHMQYLGETKEQIASEKAGIIKEGVPVVFAERQEETTQVIVEKAQKLGCDIYPVGTDDTKLQKLRNKSIDFSFKSSYYDYVIFSLSTPALYQIENAAIALRAFEVLSDCPWDIDKAGNALKNAKWEGRMEEISDHVYVDGAHNADGIEAFLKTVGQMSTSGKKTLVFSVVDDKAYEEMIDSIVGATLFDRFLVVHMPQERCVEIEKLKEIFGQYQDIDVSFAQGIREALEESVFKKEEDEYIYIAGSLYLVGFVKEALGRK